MFGNQYNILLQKMAKVLVHENSRSILVVGCLKRVLEDNREHHAGLQGLQGSQTFVWAQDFKVL